MDSFFAEAHIWAADQFSTADLGDKRRTERLVILAAQMICHPSGSFPQQTESWNDLRAAYRLFDRSEVTFEAIASPHWEQTKQCVAERLLILQDTTEIDYGVSRKVAGLSPVGSGLGQGFHLHSGLMVSCSDERIQGLAGQLIHHRQPVPKGETRTQRLRREDRESQIWCQLVDRIGAPSSRTTWVHVCDRGADDFELYCRCRQAMTDWVVRVKSPNRRILTPDGAEQALDAYMQSLPEAGRFVLNLRARPGQAARSAQFVVSFGALLMPPPKLQSPALKRLAPEPIAMTAIWVREVDVPAGAEPTEWVLYTSLPVRDFEEALLIIGYYQKRWLIEEWHKVLKTGLRVEDRQLKTSDRLEAMVGLAGVAAVRLLQLKGEARTAPERRAEEVVPPRYVKALKAIRKLPALAQLSVGQFFRELAKLGGFLGRRHDGEPGWITIWRGWEKLQLMIRGADAIIESST